MRLLLFTALLTLCAPRAEAQYVDLTRPDPAADALADVRLSLSAERREAGVVLGLEGLLSVIAGAAFTIAAYDDPFWLGFGVGMLGWGGVNAALSISLIDFGDARRAQIERDRRLRYGALADRREATVRRESDAATLFAVNFGLDFFYIGSAVLLFFLADQISGNDEPQILRGYSIAQIGQGGFLLVFDLIEWLASSDRADRAAAVARP